MKSGLHWFKKGSITVFLSMLLCILMLAITAAMSSVREAAAKTQMICGMDIGLFSMFGNYDRTAYDQFGILVLDGSSTEGSLELSGLYREFVSYMTPVLRENHRSLIFFRGGITGYRFLTDDGGKPLIHEVMKAAHQMADKGRISEVFGTSKDWNQMHFWMEKGKAMEEDPAFLEALHRQKIPEIEAQKEAMLSACGASEESNYSGQPVSKREWETGLLVADSMEFLPLEEELWNGYLNQVLGDYQNPCDSFWHYQKEYLIFGNDSDRKNLSSVLEELRWLWEGILLEKEPENSVGDPVSAESEDAESEEEKEAQRQIEIYEKSLNKVLQMLKGESEEEIRYEDYLQMKLSEVRQEQKLKRFMDCMEDTIRRHGNPRFRLDHGIVAAELFAEVQSENGKIWNLTRSYGYD